MAEKQILDFDARDEKGTVAFMRNFFDMAKKKQGAKNEEFRRVYNMYRGEMDMTNRDPNRANIFVPILYSRVETIMPQYIDALLGLRPYIPIELTSNSNADIGDAMTDLLDCYLHGGNFYWEAIKLWKYVVLFGTGYIEALPDYETRRVMRAVPQMSTDINGDPVVVGYQNVPEIQRFLKLVIRAYAPWEIYQDPYATSMDNARGVIKFRGYKSKRQLKQMAERGAFPDFDIDRLDKQMEEMREDAWGRKIAQGIGVPLPEQDDDIGLWFSYESSDRYIDLWNFNSVIRDNSNPYASEMGGHGGINLTKVINTDDPNPTESWYGLGEGKPIERLCHAINENWNQTFDNHNMQNEGVIFYAEDAFSVDQLVMVGGNRIPAEMGPTQSINDLYAERKTPGLPRDFYAIPEKLEAIADQTCGIHEIQRGEASSQEQTAREAILKKGAGDSRIKLKIRMAEEMGLGNFGIKALHILDQFATPDDIIEKIGVERAAALPTVNPGAIDGGYRFAFKGASRLADAQIKRQDAKDVYQLMMGVPHVDQGWLANWVLEKFEVPDKERRAAVRGDQEGYELQQSLAATANAESSRAVSNGATMGGSKGYTAAGRDKNEKLGAVK